MADYFKAQRVATANLHIRSGRVAKADIPKLDGAVQLLWNFTLLGTGVNGRGLRREGGREGEGEG